MKPRLEHLIVFGCSAGGKEALDYLIPRLNLHSSAAIIVPHIMHNRIYNSLRALGDSVNGVRYGLGIQRGQIHVLHGDGTLLLEGLELKDDSFQAGSYDSTINSVMASAAENYLNRCIGVVLSGAGNDGSFGVQHIKHHGGIVLVQIEDSRNGNTQGYDSSTYYPEMPLNAETAVIQQGSKPDFSGSLSELVNQLNLHISK